MLDFYVKTRIRFSLRDKRLFEITEVEITRVNCILTNYFFQYRSVSQTRMATTVLTTFSFVCFLSVRETSCDDRSMVAVLCYLVSSRRKDATRKKKRRAMRKNEKTPCEKTKKKKKKRRRAKRRNNAMRTDELRNADTL